DPFRFQLRCHFAFLFNADLFELSTGLNLSSRPNDRCTPLVGPATFHCLIIHFKQHWPALLVYLLLTTAIFATFSGVLHIDFINYDDPQYILDNPHVSTGANWENIKWAFTSHYASNWHPLTWLSHMIDVSWFGLHPAGHHLMSLLLHGANSFLLLLLLKGM